MLLATRSRQISTTFALVSAVLTQTLVFAPRAALLFSPLGFARLATQHVSNAVAQQLRIVLHAGLPYTWEQASAKTSTTHSQTQGAKARHALIIARPVWGLGQIGALHAIQALYWPDLLLLLASALPIRFLHPLGPVDLAPFSALLATSSMIVLLV